MIKTKVAFLEGRLLSNQSKQFKKYTKSSDWLEKSRPFKKSSCFDYVNRLNVNIAESFVQNKFNKFYHKILQKALQTSVPCRFL